jgi:hypothetical protein
MQVMPVTRNDLDGWAERGGPFQAWYSFNIVKEALHHESLGDLEYDIYPQGSYANETNISDGSDIDLVIALQSAFHSNTDDLQPAQLAAYQECHQSSDLTLQRFRDLVVPILTANFTARMRSKCVKVSEGLIRLPADALICIEYRHYRSFTDLSTQRHDDGVLFYADGRAIINYPKRHLVACGEKDQGTHGMFKKVVRVTKNARKHLPAAGQHPIRPETAPSYFIECLLWNVPDDRYSSDLGQAYNNVVNWLAANQENLTSLPCPNGMTTLFGVGPDTPWNEHGARRLIEALEHQLHDD